MRQLDYSFLNCLKNMPPLRHSVPEEKFDIKKSEAALWISTRPEVMQKVFNMAINHNAIRYNPNTGMWQGADYGD